MKRIDEDTISISQAELNKIQSFIDTALDSDWDQHTDKYYGYKETWEEGKRKMNPEMYDLAQEMERI